MYLENFGFVFTQNLLLWRSIVSCNRCNIVSSHKCLTHTNQTFCTMSFNRKLIKFFFFFWGGGGHISKLRGHVCFNFRVDVAWILKLAPYLCSGCECMRTTNLLQGVTLIDSTSPVYCRREIRISLRGQFRETNKSYVISWL